MGSYGIIYKITNKINGKCYIGQTTNIVNRFKKYKRLECQLQEKLYRALVKYGIDNFSFEEFDYADNQETLDFLEQIYILCFDSREQGYNIREGGWGGRMAETSKQKLRELKRSDEFKQKVSQNNSRYWKGKKRPKETGEKISLANSGSNHFNFGKHLSEQTKQRISQAKTGTRHTDESRKKMSINSARAMLGKTQTEEAKRCMSEKQRGDKSVHFGKPLSDEHRAKISASIKGRKLSDEHKRKIAEAAKKRYAI